MLAAHHWNHHHRHTYTHHAKPPKACGAAHCASFPRRIPYEWPWTVYCDSREPHPLALTDSRWTEPAILVLIVVNVIMLALQAAPPLFEPRTEGTFFRDWEDYVLFGLFIAFT